MCFGSFKFNSVVSCNPKNGGGGVGGGGGGGGVGGGLGPNILTLCFSKNVFSRERVKLCFL